MTVDFDHLCYMKISLASALSKYNPLMMKCTLIILVILVSPLSNSAQKAALDKIITKYEAYEKQKETALETSWPLNSLADLSSQHDFYTQLNNELMEIDVSALEEQSRIDHELLTLIIDDRIQAYVHEAHLFPLSAEGGFIISMLYSTRNRKLDTEEKAEEYLIKLKDTPRYIDQQIEWLREGLTETKVMPKLVVQNCLDVLRNAAGESADFLMRPFATKDISDESKLKAAKLKTQELVPWMKKLENFLQDEYLPRTYDQVGIYNNREGKAYYEQRVRYFTTLDMSPQEVYDLGHQEVKRIKGEMEAIIAELDYEGDFASFIKFLREDPQFYAETPEALLSQASWLSMKAQEILPRYFTVLPQLPFTVTPVPEEIAPTYTTGRYSGGSMEKGRAGQYWVNTYNLPARPLYVLPALTLHEAVPGHHLQISLAKSIKGLSEFRTSNYLSAYGEGWGLYAEYLGEEAGIYTTPYERFGRLTYEMWRACRLVVDPGMHYFGMTRKEAVAFMADNTSLSLHEVNTEIDRYIGWPGQAVSYKIGELKIRELRAVAEAALGEDFDIRRFHDQLLAYGSVPLTTLERLVMSWVEKEKNPEK